MVLEIKQTAKLVQQLVITPQLQQAIRLLQLTRLELVDLISQEIKENPLLEEAEEARDSAEAEATVAGPQETEWRMCKNALEFTKDSVKRLDTLFDK